MDGSGSAETNGRRARLGGLLCIGVASVLSALGLLRQGGVTCSAPFAPNDTHRRQAAAMIDGHFWLSRSIYDVGFDNVFVDGKVQQVWGLGTSIYLIPFELIGRAVGVSPFPDRVVLGVAVAAFLLYCGTLLTLLPGRGFSAVQTIGVVAAIECSPPLVNLLINGPQNVYEDASVFGLLTSLGVFVALIRFVVARKRRDLWVCCALGGMTGLVRPTHAVYGLLGAAACLVVLFRARRLRGAIGPLLLVAAGLAFLAVSNRARFGAVGEFGHRLTLTSDDGEMTSRFVSPISAQPPAVAARELAGALFFTVGDIRRIDRFDDRQFPGQAPCFRWRDFYVSSYDPTLLALIVAGAAAGAGALARGDRGAPADGGAARGAGRALLICVSTWAAVSSISLFGFMMYYPGLCARYLYDFWPGFLGFVVSAWVAASRRYPKVAGTVFLGWLVLQYWRLDCRNAPCQTMTFADVANAPAAGAAPRRLVTSGFYDRTHPPPDWLAQDCDFGRGVAGFSMRVPVDAPRFVELLVGPREPGPVEPGAGGVTRRDTYRARIGPCELRLASVVPDADPLWIQVRFVVPGRLSELGNDELLFVCFVATGDAADRASRRHIRSIRWR